MGVGTLPLLSEIVVKIRQKCCIMRVKPLVEKKEINNRHLPVETLTYFLSKISDLPTEFITKVNCTLKCTYAISVIAYRVSMVINVDILCI
jgi:hypothetical protein